MKKQFTYNGVTMEVYWNEKTYSDGKRYVEVQSSMSRKPTQLTWYEETGWAKNGGMPWAQQVADVLGWTK